MNKIRKISKHKTNFDAIIWLNPGFALLISYVIHFVIPASPVHQTLTLIILYICRY